MFFSSLAMSQRRMRKFFSFLIALNISMFIGVNYYSKVLSVHCKHNFLHRDINEVYTLQISKTNVWQQTMQSTNQNRTKLASPCKAREKSRVPLYLINWNLT